MGTTEERFFRNLRAGKPGAGKKPLTGIAEKKISRQRCLDTIMEFKRLNYRYHLFSVNLSPGKHARLFYERDSFFPDEQADSGSGYNRRDLHDPLTMNVF